MKKHVFYFNLLKIQAMKGMKIWLVGLAMLATVGAWGQGWMKTYGGEGNQGVWPVAISTTDGMVLVSSNSPFTNQGSIFFAKLNLDGEVIHEDVLPIEPTLQYALPTSIIKTNDGGFIITAYGGTTINSTQFEPVAIKISNDFQIDWIKYYDFGTSAIAEEITENSAGRYVLCGKAGGVPSFGFLLEIDENGDETWRKVFNQEPEIESFHDIMIDSDSSYIITGISAEFGTLGGYNMLVLKVDNNGEIVWNKSYGDTLTAEAGYKIARRNGGGYIICGNSEAANPVVIAIDTFGVLDWYKRLSQDDTQIVSDVIPAIGGGYLLAGRDNYGSSNENVLVVKINENGEEVWEKSIGTIEQDEGYGIIQIPFGAIYLYGTTNKLGVTVQLKQ